MGQAENFPAVAFSVRFRRYPPAELIIGALCRMAAIVTAASSSPIVATALSQASGLMPSKGRTTVVTTARKSRQEEMPCRA